VLIALVVLMTEATDNIKPQARVVLGRLN
jgi:hypothetical protein